MNHLFFTKNGNNCPHNRRSSKLNKILHTQQILADSAAHHFKIKRASSFHSQVYTFLLQAQLFFFGSSRSASAANPRSPDAAPAANRSNFCCNFYFSNLALSSAFLSRHNSTATNLFFCFLKLKHFNCFFRFLSFSLLSFSAAMLIANG